DPDLYRLAGVEGERRVLLDVDLWTADVGVVRRSLGAILQQEAVDRERAGPHTHGHRLTGELDLAGRDLIGLHNREDASVRALTVVADHVERQVYALRFQPVAEAARHLPAVLRRGQHPAADAAERGGVYPLRSVGCGDTDGGGLPRCQLDRRAVEPHGVAGDRPAVGAREVADLELKPHRFGPEVRIGQLPGQLLLAGVRPLERAEVDAAARQHLGVDRSGHPQLTRTLRVDAVRGSLLDPRGER